jgi:hypothetical protein
VNLVNAFNVAPESVVLMFWAVVLFGLAGGLRRAVAARIRGAKQRQMTPAPIRRSSAGASLRPSPRAAQG